ncbi:EAL domain-containing protein [Undibacterium sp. SXout7W]|uniref:EAL domain-containing protein n=1 Tax=Undibacterium sp. SXout7W TaxID=3413049 RepID=UPI003BF3A9EF
MIVLVGCIRYSLMIESETGDARQRAGTELRQLQHFLPPVLSRLSDQADASRIRQLLQQEVSSSQEIGELSWQYGQQIIQATEQHLSPNDAPEWFIRRLPLTVEMVTQQIPLSNGETATFQLQTTTRPSSTRIWNKVKTQLKISLGLIIAVYFFLGLILHSTGQTLRRLANASNRFRLGEHSVRMEVVGNTEARALATTFNSMAEEVQTHLASLQQSQTELATEKERAETTLSSIGDAVISTDLHGRVLTLNKVAQELTGWDRHDAYDQPLQQIFFLPDPVHSHTLRRFVEAIDEKTDLLQADNQQILSRSGKPIDVNYTATAIRQQNGDSTGCVLIFRDVSEKRLLLSQISWQAVHDVLTGLENRTALTDRFTLAIEQAQCQGNSFAVCLLDLDHFHQLNEKYGQEFSDKLLQQVARRLENNAGEGNAIARLGGDEFVVLMQNQTDSQSVEYNLNKLLQVLAQPYAIEQHTIHMTASIGVAMYPRDDINPDTLLRCADQAMYQAKLSGRNKYHLFDAQQDQEVRTHHNQRANIRQALRNEEFRLYFQPKVDMQQGTVIGMEALLRWQHPEKGIVGPLSFLPLVEQTDLIIDIGDWVLHQALAQLRCWVTAGKSWIVSVNIAARHFQSKDFLPRLRSILEQYPEVPAQLLEIEILESAAIQDIQYVREVMLACQQLGVRFALDDFGTGYSSLSYLKRLPANILKIDQSFVRDMLDDQEDLALISAIISLSTAFRREVIAEGVETHAQGEALIRLGCTLGQGYGIARPMPAAQVMEWAGNFTTPKEWQQT